MALVNWLPIGFNLPDGSHTKQALYEGPGWQIIDTASGKRALLAKEDLPNGGYPQAYWRPAYYLRFHLAR